MRRTGLQLLIIVNAASSATSLRSFDATRATASRGHSCTRWRALRAGPGGNHLAGGPGDARHRGAAGIDAGPYRRVLLVLQPARGGSLLNLHLTKAHAPRLQAAADRLIAALADCPSVCEHLHLPVQAGDDDVLRRMGRQYTTEHYLERLAAIHRVNGRVALGLSIVLAFSIGLATTLSAVGIVGFVRQNLFNGWFNTLLTPR